MNDYDTSEDSNSNKNLSIANVQAFLVEGDNLIKAGEFDKAKESFDKARNLAKQLAGFYKDLNGSFKGLDARIPNEMAEKGRESLKIWAESNARLAAVPISSVVVQKHYFVDVPFLVTTRAIVVQAHPPGRMEAVGRIPPGAQETM